jgi:hypothetical protein
MFSTQVARVYYLILFPKKEMRPTKAPSRAIGMATLPRGNERGREEPRPPGFRTPCLSTRLGNAIPDTPQTDRR